ncbi:hypothetical protein U9M48_008206, partial [Paspalum notatum var. saurae]
MAVLVGFRSYRECCVGSRGEEQGSDGVHGAVGWWLECEREEAARNEMVLIFVLPVDLTFCIYKGKRCYECKKCHRLVLQSQQRPASTGPTITYPFYMVVEMLDIFITSKSGWIKSWIDTSVKGLCETLSTDHWLWFGKSLLDMVQNLCLLSKWLFKLTNEEGVWKIFLKIKYLRPKRLGKFSESLRILTS